MSGITYNTHMETKNGSIEKIVVLAHPQISEAVREVALIAEYLASKNMEVVEGLLSDEAIRERVRDGEFDVVIALGGDGTVLRAGHFCAPKNIPILAINYGNFGFLIEVSKDNWKESIDKLLAGKYWVETRMMLNARVWRGNECIGTWEVLNDMVIARGDNLRPVQLSTSLDGNFLTTYMADALIVATPTGSTAYALAAGGPILPPELKNILLIPVAPHLSIDRAIVLAKGSLVSVTVLSYHEVIASGDGQDPLQLIKGDRVDVSASKYTVPFIRFQEAGYFYRNLVSLMDQNPSSGVQL